jgi:tetratricopeptide (TPR) repeat protein
MLAAVLVVGAAGMIAAVRHQNLKQEMVQQLHASATVQLAQELHEIADRFRLIYGAESLPVAKLEALAGPCRRLWDQRDLILQRLHGKDLDRETAKRVEMDLLDLAILGADLRVRLAKTDDLAAAHVEALQMLSEAEALFGPNAVLLHERQRYAAALGQTEVVRQTHERASLRPPRTAWEHYAIGRSLLNSGEPEAASSHLEKAAAMQPDNLWCNFYRGVCCYRLGRYEDATLAFIACTALAPNSADCFYNRALAFARLGRGDRAVRDCDRALALDPNFTDAALLKNDQSAR